MGIDWTRIVRVVVSYSSVSVKYSVNIPNQDIHPRLD